jgi:hypothetical protein
MRRWRRSCARPPSALALPTRARLARRGQLDVLLALCELAALAAYARGAGLASPRRLLVVTPLGSPDRGAPIVGYAGDDMERAAP